MILEGLVTTLTQAGEPHLAPMGPQVDADYQRFILKPYSTSNTYCNLKVHPEGVLHVTDNVLMIAQSAIGVVRPFPQTFPPTIVRGVILNDCCRAYEFRVTAIDDSVERIQISCDIVANHTMRDFFGFNRAKHAVIEAAVLASRLHLLSSSEVEAEFLKLQVLVSKTGGLQEHSAFELLDHYRRSYQRDKE